VSDAVGSACVRSGGRDRCERTARSCWFRHHKQPESLRSNDWNRHRQQPENPRPLRSRASLSTERAELSRDDERRPRASLEPRASLTAFAAVLASSGFPERAAPFIPTRFGWFDSLSGWE